MHSCPTEMFILLDLPFAGRTILVVRDFLQLPTICVMSVYISSPDANHPMSYTADDSWRIFLVL